MEWIDVNDRLPDKYETVLIAHGNSKVNRSLWNPLHKCWHFYGIIHKGVTHWMPLPSPPKQKEQL